MKYTLLLFFAFFCLFLQGQTSRKSQIENRMSSVFSEREFQQLADSLHMSVDELTNYPVIFPIKKPLRISSHFGMRYHPVYRKQKFHSGIDIPKPEGTPVYATGNGGVLRKGYSSTYGLFLEIKHASGFSSFYAHLSKIHVNTGDWVTIATQIAHVGSTGVSTGSHLHYEIRKTGRMLNPTGWCSSLFNLKIQTVQPLSNK